MKIPRPAIAVLALLALSCGESRPLAAVADIDSTLTDGRYKRRIPRKVALPRAAAVLSRLEREGIAIVYLSKRHVRQLPATVRWLETNGFPRGAKVIHRADPAETGLDFKIRELARLKKAFDIVCAFGNEDDDRLAYAREGLFSLTRPSWRDEDWAEAEKIIMKIIRSGTGAEDAEKE